MMTKTWSTFVYFARAYPAKSVIMVLALTIAGILEGLGIVTLLPLITILTEQEGASDSKISQLAHALFDFLGQEPTVLTALSVIVIFMILKAALSMLAVFQIAYTSSHVAASLRLEYIQNLLNARWAHYIGVKTGKIANAIGTEAQRAAVCFRQGCQVFAYLVQIVIYAVLAFLVSWQLTAAAVLAGAIMVAILGFLVREARRSGNKLTNVYDDTLGFVTDSFYGVKPLKAMNKGRELFTLLKKDILDLKIAQRRLDVVDQSLLTISEPILVLFVAVGLFGALSFSNLPLAELLFMAVLFLRMVMRVATMQSVYQSMTSNESALWSLQDKVKQASDEAEQNTGAKVPKLENAIRFDSVSFSYDQEPILQDFSDSFSVNGLHIIFGPSGTGKTTLIDLIIGLHKPTSGNIYIDDTPLSDIDIQKWRDQIGYVPQDVLLFHDTVLNNLTLNDPDLGKDKAEQALKMAGAWDFVSKMEEGLDTVVGERGSRLSGGQRQRIAIARAIIHQPSLLILDEATSALDPETEKQILQTVKDLSKNMTVLAISHNPAILECADHLHELKKHAGPTEDIKGSKQAHAV